MKRWLAIALTMLLTLPQSAHSQAVFEAKANDQELAEDKPVTKPKSQPRPTGAQQVTIETLSGTVLATSIQSLASGRLVIAGSKPSEIPLDQVLRIDWRNDQTFSALWIGQDRLAEGRDVADMHVRLRGLKRDVGVRKVEVSGPWRQPGSRAPELERTPGATVGDLYYEPPEKDDFGKKHYVTVTYDDDSTARILFECTSHTTHRPQPGAKRAVATKIVVYGTEGSRLSGELLGLDERVVRLKSGWGAEIALPRATVAAWTLPEQATSAAVKVFDERHAAPTAEDVALVLPRDEQPSGKAPPAKEASAQQVSGTFLGIADGKLRFRYEGEVRSIGLERVVGVIVAKTPPTKAASSYQSFELANGDVVIGSWQGLTAQDVRIAAWGGTVQVPRKWIDAITFHDGKVTYLSSLAPTKIEQTPYFERVWPYARNRSLSGAPLMVGGVQYARGVAVHARTVLTYVLDVPRDRFQTMIGFDDQAGRAGRAACRVLGDGKVLWQAQDLRATEPPQKLDLAIAGVRTLVLEVDFGEDADVGDRVVWADARLLREMAP